MTDLETRLGYHFRNSELLLTALTHSSYANEKKGSHILCNERLEFLGDSILGVTVAEYLYKHYPEMPEGRMTRLRSELVCEQSLYHIAQSVGLGDFIRLGKGELRNGGAARPSILSDATEALIAAVYLDSDMNTAAALIQRFLLNNLSEEEPQCFSDFKTGLQELVQKKSGQHLSYVMLSEEGPDHAKSFTVEVTLNGMPLARGTGHTKKEAEQNAAKRALELLQE